jgi:hypothetical protein
MKNYKRFKFLTGFYSRFKKAKRKSLRSIKKSFLFQNPIDFPNLIVKIFMLTVCLILNRNLLVNSLSCEENNIANNTQKQYCNPNDNYCLVSFLITCILIGF